MAKSGFWGEFSLVLRGTLCWRVVSAFRFGDQKCRLRDIQRESDIWATFSNNFLLKAPLKVVVALHACWQIRLVAAGLLVGVQREIWFAACECDWASAALSFADNYCKLQLNLPHLRICSADLGEVSIKMSSPTLFLQSFLRLTAQCRRQRSTKSGTKFQSFLPATTVRILCSKFSSPIFGSLHGGQI